MGASQSVAETLFQRMKEIKNNFVLVSNYLQIHNERCDVLATHLVNCESWLRNMKDDDLRREVTNVRAELLEEKYTRKMDLQKLEEAEENINLMLMFFEKFGVKVSSSGKELTSIDANLIASVEQGVRDRRTVDLLKEKTLLQEQLAEKNDELKRAQEIMKLETKASSSKKEEEFRTLVSKQSSTISNLRSQILKLSEENNKLLSEQLQVPVTEKEKSRSRKKEKKSAEDKKNQDQNEKEAIKSNPPSRSSSKPPDKVNQEQQQSDDKTGGSEGNFDQQQGGFYRGNRGNRSQQNYFHQGGRGDSNTNRGGGNYHQTTNPNYGRGHYVGNQQRGFSHQRPFQRGGLLDRVSTPDLSPEAMHSLVQQQQAIIQGLQEARFHEENANYARGRNTYQRRGFGGHPRPFQRGGPGGERTPNYPEKEKEQLSPEALLALIKKQQDTIDTFHSQNLKLHEDNTKLVAKELAQAMAKKENKANKRKDQHVNAGTKAESSNQKQESGEKMKTQEKEDRIFACDVCGQISTDLYSLQVHAAFCNDEH